MPFGLSVCLGWAGGEPRENTRRQRQNVQSQHRKHLWIEATTCSRWGNSTSHCCTVPQHKEANHHIFRTEICDLRHIWIFFCILLLEVPASAKGRKKGEAEIWRAKQNSGTCSTEMLPPLLRSLCSCCLPSSGRALLFFPWLEKDVISQQRCFPVPKPLLCVCSDWWWTCLSRCMCTPCI